MEQFSLNLPINPVSFGQVSTAFLRGLHKRGYEPCIFPIGNNVDLSSQGEKPDSDFHKWLASCLNKSLSKHSRGTPVVKLWHINGSMESVSSDQVLYTFYELDSPTNEEINILKNQSCVLVSNSYTKSVFESFGVKNCEVVPLGFDSHNFKKLDKEYFKDDRVVFLLLGKFENRKHHQKVIRAWIKKYGNNPKYFLSCALFNPFLKPEQNQALFNQCVEGNKYFNVQFLGFMAQNELYNDFLNSGHIVIGMSGAEGWGLGEFQATALGKHCVGLNAHGHKEWMTEENAVLVNPCGKKEIYDGMFFHKGQPFNQGNMFDFDDEEFLNACDKAVERHEANPINIEGLKLQEEFTYDKFTESVIKSVDNLIPF